MIQSGQFSNSSEILSMFTLSASFMNIQLELNLLRWWQSKTEAFFSNQGDVALRLFDPIWQVFQIVRDFIHVHLICKFQEHPIKPEWVTLSQSLRLFSNQGDEIKFNNPIWPVFKLFQDFIHVHIIFKFKEHLIKTEWVTLTPMSNRGFFRNQVDVTLRLLIRPGQFSNLSETSILCPPHLQVSGTSDQNWMNYTDDKIKQRLFSNQGNVTRRTVIWSGQFPNLYEISFLCPPHRQVSGTSDQEWMNYADNKVKQSLFFSNQGDITVRLMIRSGRFLKLSEVFIHVPTYL